jgi:hypothetical protein
MGPPPRDSGIKLVPQPWLTIPKLDGKNQSVLEATHRCPLVRRSSGGFHSDYRARSVSSLRLHSLSGLSVPVLASSRTAA